MSKLKKVKEKFQELHQSVPLMVQSPGRINLIGEHVDYNLGAVLPAAIDKKVYLAISSRQDQEINLFAADYGDQYVTSLNEIKSAWKLWPNYILGVINELKNLGKIDRGVNIVLGGDIPLAAGLSSSAAVTCATAFAINVLYNLDMSRLELALLAQRAEHSFVGVHCGLMDQFASLFGKEGHLLKLDCKTNGYRYIPFSAPNVEVVLFDTRVKHHLVSSAYNERRRECQRGLEILRRNEPTVRDFSDVTESMLVEHLKPIPSKLFDRCLYVIQEMERVELGCRDLEYGNFSAFGKKMFQTHEGLKTLYEVSCAESDFLVNLSLNNSDILGSRMMGGGFGGCTINLIKGEGVEKSIEVAKEMYFKEMGKELKVYRTSLSEGTNIVE